MAQDELLTGRDLAAAGQVLTQSFDLLWIHLPLCPSHVLLEFAQSRQLGLSALDRFVHLRTRCALELRQKSRLYRWRDAFDGVKPRLIHSWEREKEQARPGDRRKHQLPQRAE